MEGPWVRPWVGSVYYGEDETGELMERYLARYPAYREPQRKVASLLLRTA
jgi:hypothetical protein